MIKTRSIYFKQEQEAWQRTLDYLQQQNIALKVSLATVSGKQVSGALLEKLEYFQNKFVEKDALITLLRRDIIILNRLLESDGDEEVHSRQISDKQHTLRKDIEQMEKDFSSLKYSFSRYMAEVL